MRYYGYSGSPSFSFELSKRGIRDISVEFIDSPNAVNRFSGRGGRCFKIIQHPNDGNHPHLHLIFDDKRSYIRLDTSSYFDHGKFNDALDKEECQIFDNVMRSRIRDITSSYKGGYYDTVWEACVNVWNGSGSRYTMVPTGTGKPTYWHMR